MYDLPTLLSIAAFFLTLVGSLWGIIKFLLIKIENVRTELNTEMLLHRADDGQKLKDVYAHITEMKDTFARREDLVNHAERVETGITNINNRLDNFLNLLIKSSNNNNKGD